MEVNLERFEETLKAAETVVLATSRNDAVSARPVSIMNIGLRLFVRTSGSSRKAQDMAVNPSVAICVGNFYFTGKAKSSGSVFDERNAEIRTAYIARFPGAFSIDDEFIQSDEQFFEISVERVSEWIYENGVPVGFAESTLEERKIQK